MEDFGRLKENLLEERSSSLTVDPRESCLIHAEANRSCSGSIRIHQVTAVYDSNEDWCSKTLGVAHKAPRETAQISNYNYNLLLKSETHE